MSKKTKKNNVTVLHQNILDLRPIVPLTANQGETFDAYDDGYNLVLHGYAGTGKTFISMYLALKEILSFHSQYDRVVIVRSVVPSREMGFLPGSLSEKTEVFEEPYQEICTDLFTRLDAYTLLKNRKKIEFTTTSFLRGTTLNNAIVIADEVQNLSFHECDTVMTRIGENSRIIYCGDFRQTDLNKPHEKEGMTQFMRIIDNINTFRHIEFKKEDICRSELVKQYIIQKAELGF
jgi:phosphate starvation-inducible protein PhoH